MKTINIHTVILSFLLLLCDSAPAWAENYPMFEDGKRWYVNRDNGWGSSVSYGSWYCDGTRTVDEIEYFVMYYEDLDGNVEEDCLVREDNGKIYLRPTEEGRFYKSHFEFPGWDYINNEKFTLDCNKEYLTFDNNTKPGESIDILTQNMGNETFAMIRVMIDKRETLTLWGKDLTLTSYKNNTYVDGELYDYIRSGYFLEGIGCEPHGLPYISFWGPEYTGQDTEYNIIKVTIGDDIFYQNYIGNPNANNFIREDKVWEYGRSEKLSDNEQKYSMSELRFDGTEEIDGKVYHKLMQTKETSWNLLDGKLTDKPVVNEQPQLAGLLREEYFKVWMRVPEGTSIVKKEWVSDDKAEETPVEDCQEVLLYDFSCVGGQTMPVYIEPIGAEGTDNVGIIMDYFIYSCGYCARGYYEDYDPDRCFESYEIYGQAPHLDSFNYSKFYFSPVAGNVGKGTIFGPMAVATADADKYDCWFNNQYNLSGKVLYPGVGMKVPDGAGVDTITTDESGRDMRMYDLMGREIKNPLPGTIYIQNGRKLIAR